MRARKVSFAKRLRWRLECGVHSMVERIAAWLPGPCVFRLGEALGGLARHLMPQRRTIVMRNLRIAFAGSKSPAELEKLVKETFRRTGGNMLAVAHTARLPQERLAQVVTVKGTEHLTAALAEGRGVVVMLPHMGNWEVLSRLHLVLPEETKLGAFYRPLNNPLMNERVLKRRQADGARMFSKHDSPLQATRFLRENGMLGILADQRVGQQGDLVPFFGRLTRSSPLPGLLARRVKCPLLALSMVTVRPGEWEVRFHPVEGSYTTENAMVALEKAMKASPIDAFWFQERWKLYLRRRTSLGQWLGGKEQQGKTPHRALIWLAGAPASWRPPEDWLHPDVVYEVAQTPTGPKPAWLSDSIRVHRIDQTVDRSTLQEHVAEIDASGELPLDFILTPDSREDLMEAARRESVPVISLR